MQTLEELVRQLPPELHQEVQDFVEFLLHKHTKPAQAKPNFEWAGALKDLREDFDRTDKGRQTPGQIK